MRKWIERWWSWLGFVSSDEVARAQREAARMVRELDELAGDVRRLDEAVAPHEPQIRIHHGPPPDQG